MIRNELVELWGYDQILLVDNSRFEELTLKQLSLKGLAGQYEVTLEDFLKSIIGHEKHHINIIKERYI